MRCAIKSWCRCIHVSACCAAIRRPCRPDDVECLDSSNHLISDVHRRHKLERLARVHHVRHAEPTMKQSHTGGALWLSRCEVAGRRGRSFFAAGLHAPRLWSPLARVSRGHRTPGLFLHHGGLLLHRRLRLRHREVASHWELLHCAPLRFLSR